MRMTRFGLMIALAGMGLMLAACETTEPGVKSSMFVQYTSIAAGTAEGTKAAANVLENLGLHDIETSSTNIDGWAKGVMADKTPVKVTFTRVGNDVSDISVHVGSFGDPALGQEIIARVRKELGLKIAPTGIANQPTN